MHHDVAPGPQVLPFAVDLTLLLWILAWLVIWIIVLSIAEFLHPERPGRIGRLTHIARNQLFTFSSVAALLLLLQIPFGTAFETTPGGGLFGALPVPAVIQFLILMLCIDLYYYLMHRASHHFDFMWRVHRTHHSDTQVDATSTYRTHAIEFAWLFGGKTLLALALGINPVYALSYDVLVGTLGAYYHSNIKINERIDRTIRIVFVTQRWHLSHHSNDIRYTNRNYATFFSFWDRLFGTARMAPDPAKITFGITQLDSPRWQSFVGMWTTPFRSPKRADTGP